MLKKVLILLLLGTNYTFANNQENPTALFEPKYRISEMDMKILIRQLNNIEHCIFPDLAKPDYQKVYDSWGVADKLTMEYFEHQILQELLGKENYQTMRSDELSMYYFSVMHQRLNHQKANVDNERCEAFKPTYNEIYKQLHKAQLSNAK